MIWFVIFIVYMIFGARVGLKLHKEMDDVFEKYLGNLPMKIKGIFRWLFAMTIVLLAPLAYLIGMVQAIRSKE